MKHIVITTDGLRRYPLGAVMELPEQEADDLVRGGYAVPVLPTPAPTDEIAVEPVAETPPVDAPTKPRK